MRRSITPIHILASKYGKCSRRIVRKHCKTLKDTARQPKWHDLDASCSASAHVFADLIKT